MKREQMLDGETETMCQIHDLANGGFDFQHPRPLHCYTGASTRTSNEQKKIGEEEKGRNNVVEITINQIIKRWEG